MRRWALIIFSGLCLCAGLGYWLYVRSHAVSWALSGQMQRGPGTVVDFAEIAPFPWDRVYVFGPYTPQGAIDASLGFHWEGAGSSAINGHKGQNLVVFVRAGEVVYWFDHPRNEELTELADPHGYARNDARFIVRKDVRDATRLELVPMKR
jgi:hypothetical protein